MKKFKGVFLVLIIISFLGTMNLAAKKKSKLPKQLKQAFEQTEQGEAIKTGLEINFSDIKFFPAQGEKTNIIVGFKFKEIEDKDKNDTKKASQEMNDVLAIRIINKKKPKEKVTVFSPVSNINRNVDNRYYFEIQAKPGDYEIVGIISTKDLKKMGSRKIDITVPDMFPNRISFSSLILYKDIKKLDEAPIGFKIYKDSYPMGMYMIYPYESNIITGENTPRLLYFIVGAKKNKLSKKYQIQITYKLLQGDKTVEKFKPVVINNTVVDQPLPLIVKGEKLSGEYVFEIEIMDVVSREKSKTSVKLNYK